MRRPRACSRAGALVTAAALLLGCGEARAQFDGYDTLVPTGAGAAAVRLRVDSSHVVRRVPSAATLERLREDRDFDYGWIHRDPESLAERLRRLFADWVRDLLGADGVVTAWDVAVYVLLGAALVFVAIKLSDADARALFFRRRDGSSADAIVLEEDVHGIDYPSQIQRAVAAGDLRLAVRLHYLRLLRDLSERGAIAWRPDKTDADYLRELRDTPLSAGFERAALLFEYVWYGDFPIDRPGYERLASVIDRVGAL